MEARQVRFAPTQHWFFLTSFVAWVSVTAAVAFAVTPALRTVPAGAATVLLALGYVGWQYLWFWQNPLFQSALRWRLLAWSGNLALCLALLVFARPFAILLFILAAQSFHLLRLPLGPIGTAVAAALGWFAWQGRLAPRLPQSAREWYALTIGLLALTVWLVAGFLVESLFAARVRNERLIAELRESQARLREAAARERELAALRERERLARDLHDTLGHALVLATVKVEAAQRLGPVDPARADAELASTKSLLRETMNELRRTVGNLRDPGTPLDRRSLAATIAAGASATAERSGLRARVACDEIGGLTAAQEDALWRVAQEALTNVIKHAGATELRVRLARGDGRVSLEIRDDGRGPTGDGKAPDRPGHFGIRGMHERMALVGGRLTVAAAPGGGTRVLAELPLDAGAG
ncbi:MAG: sensor histidine kinase [Chloroflexota bacterium]|nr:sensor histidine kinase [Chloroflexota bacterium]